MRQAQVGFAACPMFVMMLAALPVFGAVKTTNLTIVFDFNGPHSVQSVEAMKRETQGILKGAGVHLDWKSRDEAVNSTFADLVVVRFKGACQLPPPPLYDELGEIGPLASTFETDGQVQPFSEVSCDRVGAFVRSGLHGTDFQRGDLLIGRLWAA